jgi:hypothetical protein
MGNDLYYAIPQFFEKRISEHSAVTSWVRLPCEEEFIYRISRIRYGDQVLVWLADQYLFTDMDFYNRPQQLRPEDYILIAKPEASGRVSAELIRQYRIGVGKLGMFMGALNKRNMWTYEPPDEEEKARRRERQRNALRPSVGG